jgi:hypothetical protein
VDPALWELMREGREDDVVEAIVRLSEGIADTPGVRIVSRFGSIATCRLPRRSISEVHDQEGVVSLKRPRILAPEPDVPVADLRILGSGPPTTNTARSGSSLPGKA